LNCRPHPYQGCALPTELPGPKTKTPSRTIAPIHTIRWRPATPLPLSLERVMGIEPTPSAWKAEVLPLNYTRESPRPQNRIRRLRTTRRSKSLQAISSNLSSVLILPRSWGDFTVHTLVEGGGFEPPKAEPSDLQSDPFDRSGTPPKKRRYSLATRPACQLSYCRNSHYPAHYPCARRTAPAKWKVLVSLTDAP
jgi:hypothetical protein